MKKFEELPPGLIFKPGRGWFIDLDAPTRSDPQVAREPYKEPHPLTRNVRSKRQTRREPE